MTGARGDCLVVLGQDVAERVVAGLEALRLQGRMQRGLRHGEAHAVERARLLDQLPQLLAEAHRQPARMHACFSPRAPSSSSLCACLLSETCKMACMR